MADDEVYESPLKSLCTSCPGDGFVHRGWDEDGNDTIEVCETCGGDGWV